MDPRDENDANETPIRAEGEEGQLDFERSAELAQAIEAEYKQCYRNAVMALLLTDDLVDCVYVEGYVLFSLDIPIAHGWLYDPATDRVLDPTAALLDEPTTRYFPGERYDRETTRRRAIGARKMLPLAEPHNSVGIRRAMRQCYRACGFELPWPDENE